jgi:predicted NAD-dependent protein-ADP-ribosyltransferase YbiA (DUF1768 family)
VAKVNEQSMRARIKRIKGVTEAAPQTRIVFARPTEGDWGFLSPLWKADFEVDGWVYGTMEMWMDASKAKAVEREDVWKQIIQGLIGSSEQEIKGFEVRLDNSSGERSVEEITWADGESREITIGGS